jgi:ATP-binding cassette, subfamily B, bacterial
MDEKQNNPKDGLFSVAYIFVSEMSFVIQSYKEPELLLLDEATSHLDIESERDIQDSLHKFFDEVTAVVIAHRLTTIKEMDRILVIENGRIIEEGSFNKLMRLPKGRFRDLWKKQKI